MTKNQKLQNTLSQGRAAVISVLLFVCSFLPPSRGVAQVATTGANVVTTAVPFLTIGPDSRGNGLGDVGVATTPDANSMHWNPAKYARVADLYGVSFSYVPWLRNIANDITLCYLSGYYHPDVRQSFAASIRYFTFGDIKFFDETATYSATSRPNELALDFAYALNLSKTLSAAVAFRYIRSDLMTELEDREVGNAFSGDLSMFYSKEVRIRDVLTVWSWGVNISNIGTKITYTDTGSGDFIPTNLKIGTSLGFGFNPNHRLTVANEFNKLLVPTPQKTISTEGNAIWVGGGQSNQSVLGGIFSSFSDAQGGFSEELREISWAMGLEYELYQRLALRTGYFHESNEKGGRQYLTAGLGVRMEQFGIDFSYLMPTKNNHPLENTIRFSLVLNGKK